MSKEPEVREVIRRYLEEVERVSAVPGENPFEKLTELKRAQAKADADRRVLLESEAEARHIQAQTRLREQAQTEKTRKEDFERQQRILAVGFMNQTIFPYAIEEVLDSMPSFSTEYSRSSSPRFDFPEIYHNGNQRDYEWRREPTILEDLVGPMLGKGNEWVLDDDRKFGSSGLRVFEHISVQASPLGEITLLGKKRITLPRSHWEKNIDLQAECLDRVIRNPVSKLQRVRFSHTTYERDERPMQ